MTPTMYDGPPANLPGDGDAYAGYLNPSGIGATYDQVKADHLGKPVLSITTQPGYIAQCGDVERGALSSWAGFTVGYCSAGNAAALISRDGRPRWLWTAHVNQQLGDHICGPDVCGYPQADATQCRQNVPPGYDFSLLTPAFLAWLTGPPAPTPIPPVPLLEATMEVSYNADGTVKTIVGQSSHDDQYKGNNLICTWTGTAWEMIDVTEVVKNQNPADPRVYQIG